MAGARPAGGGELSSSDDDTSLIGHLLFDIRNWMRLRKADRMFSRDIIAALNCLHDRPWQTLFRGRILNEYWLAVKLREFGIRPRSVRLGEATGKGYLLEEIEAAFRRYVPNAEVSLAQVAGVGKQGGTG